MSTSFVMFSLINHLEFLHFGIAPRIRFGPGYTNAQPTEEPLVSKCPMVSPGRRRGGMGTAGIG